MGRVIRYLCRSDAVAGVMSFLWWHPDHARSASFIRDYQHWIDKKGYSTDYIEQKTGKRQPGLAGAWRGNIPVQDAQPGDVEWLPLRVPGAMHAALVEEVRKNPDGAVRGMRVSEWNRGQVTDRRCLITENFGRLAPPRWIDPNAVAHV